MYVCLYLPNYMNRHRKSGRANNCRTVRLFVGMLTTECAYAEGRKTDLRCRPGRRASVEFMRNVMQLEFIRLVEFASFRKVTR